MRIKRAEPLNIEAILDWQDFERLEQGNVIGDRYDAENKLLIQMSYPFNPHDSESRQKSFQKKESAEFNRTTMDIEVFIPQGVLRDARVVASNFSEKLGNLKITPSSEYCAGMKIRVVYPGSLKVIDIPDFYEQLIG